MFSPDTKILIVDDMLTMRKIVQKTLSTFGFSSFVTAKDGAEAWSILQEDKSIGLIVSDWNMPNLTGIELLKKVRGHDEIKGTPFVLLTAESESNQVQEALVAGVDNYVVKPFAAATLKSKLEVTYQKFKSRNAA